MKQLFILLLFAATAQAQDPVRNAVLPLNADDEGPYEVIIRKNNSYEPGRIENIPSPVMSVFLGSYNGAQQVSWFMDENYCTAYFLYDEKISIVKYRHDGLKIALRKTYSANKIKPALSEFLVSETNPGFEARYVTETERDNRHIYEINLVKDKQWMILKIGEEPNGKFTNLGRLRFDK